MSISRCIKTLAPMSVALLALNGAAFAQTTASSLAYGENVAVAVGAVQISSGPLPSASGDAPPAYSVGPNSSAGVTVTTALTGSILQTGLLQASASSPVPGSDSATANAIVDDLALDIVGGLLFSLITIDADTLEATATVSGTCGESVTASGGATFENADVGGTLGGSLQIPVNPPANTVLLDNLGIRIVLNEQVVTGDGVDERSIEVNALHVQLTPCP